MNPPAAPVTGSHLWQLVFVSFAIVLILFEVIRGWNRGIARQLARLGGLIAGSLAAYFGASFVVPVARPFLTLPDPTLWLLAAVALFLITYLVINTIGAILFKRTKQYESAIVRIVCGFGGAIFGLFFGALLVWGIVIGVRSLGSIADAKVQQQNANQAAVPARTLHAVDVRRRLAGDPLPEDSSVMVSLARLKNSVELGSVGELVKKTDVAPLQTYYDTLGKVGKMVSNPEAMERFLSFPGAQQLSNHPRLVALRGDPEVARLIEEGRYLELVQNPRVIEAINDPTLIDQIKAFDLKRALDYSLQGQ